MASPSPANIRDGSSPSRLNGNTPAANGNDPAGDHASTNVTGRCAHQNVAVPLRMLVPHKLVVVSPVRSRSRILTTYSSALYRSASAGHSSSSCAACGPSSPHVHPPGMSAGRPCHHPPELPLHAATELAGQFRLTLNVVVIATHGVSDLSEITHAPRRNDRVCLADWRTHAAANHPSDR